MLSPTVNLWCMLVLGWNEQNANHNPPTFCISDFCVVLPYCLVLIYLVLFVWPSLELPCVVLCFVVDPDPETQHNTTQTRSERKLESATTRHHKTQPQTQPIPTQYTNTIQRNTQHKHKDSVWHRLTLAWKTWKGLIPPKPSPNLSPNLNPNLDPYSNPSLS